VIGAGSGSLPVHNEALGVAPWGFDGPFPLFDEEPAMTDDCQSSQRGVSATGKLAGDQSPVTWTRRCPKCAAVITQAKPGGWSCACGWRER
jgi:hypothetical protein